MAYIRAHRLEAALEELMAALLFAQPPDPLAFVASEAVWLQRVYAQGRAGGLFTRGDLHALFSLHDPARTGAASGQQLRSALAALGLPPPPVEVDGEGRCLTEEVFVAALEGAIGAQARLFAPAAPVVA